MAASGQRREGHAEIGPEDERAQAPRARMNLKVPQGFKELLRDLTEAILREQPEAGTLYEFAASFFDTALENRQSNDVQLQENQGSKDVQFQNKPMYTIVDDDEEEEVEDEKPSPVPQTMAVSRHSRRRPSVCGEPYNPEEDVDEVAPVVHAKTDSQRERLTQAVKNILLFRSLEQEQINKLLDAMFEKQVESGETVIVQGDDGDNFYVIDTGVYDVLLNDTKVFQFDNQGSFGELALMYNTPRTATVRCEKAGTLWAMDRNSFRKIVLKSAFEKRKKYESLLESVNILQSLDPYERMTLADALVTRVYEDGEIIIEQGDRADGMYFVEEGNVRVTITANDGREQEIAQQTNTIYFGELALINNKPRTANVYAQDRVKVAFLERDCFERLLGPCLGIMKRNSMLYTMYADGQ